VIVTKKKSASKKEEAKGRTKIGNLKLDRETVKDLTGSAQKQIKGGLRARTNFCNGTSAPGQGD
jgi:hypothetical protein